jgi:murein L,D-transpeptidase YafK
MTSATAIADRAGNAAKRVAPILVPKFKAIGSTLGAPIFIRILKTEQVLQLYVQSAKTYKLLESYPICAFSGGLGPKQREGDMQAPEGVYYISKRQLNPASQYHLSFNLGYPNALDQALARTGSALMVHGNCVSIGCYAMTDAKIEEIYTVLAAALERGQTQVPVHIFPFALHDQALANYQDSEWLSFWRDLQPIYQSFERTNLPPKVSVKNKRYVLAK